MKVIIIHFLTLYTSLKIRCSQCLKVVENLFFFQYQKLKFKFMGSKETSIIFFYLKQEINGFKSFTILKDIKLRKGNIWLYIHLLYDYFRSANKYIWHTEFYWYDLQVKYKGKNQILRLKFKCIFFYLFTQIVILII